MAMNMARADLRKEGAAYDLTIALESLPLSEQIKAKNISDHIILGELSLDGSLKPLNEAFFIGIKANRKA